MFPNWSDMTILHNLISPPSTRPNKRIQHHIAAYFEGERAICAQRNKIRLSRRQARRRWFTMPLLKTLGRLFLVPTSPPHQISYVTTCE